MYNFQYANPTRICFGEGQIASLPELIPSGSRLLVLYGGGSIKQNGVYEQLTRALEGVTWQEFSGIGANPRFELLMEAVAQVKRERIDFLLAVGGGSVVDGTKFVAAAACYEGDDPWDICGKQASVHKALPMGCVLTLPATGSENNPTSVVSRGDVKISFRSPLVQPQFAVLDPATTYSLPPRQTGNGVVDAFVHIAEQYLTFPVGGEVQDRLAEGLLQVLVEKRPQGAGGADQLSGAGQSDVGGQSGAQRPYRLRSAAGLGLSRHRPSADGALRAGSWPESGGGAPLTAP